MSLKTPLLSLTSAFSLLAAPASSLQAAGGAAEGGQDAALVLAAGFIALGLMIRRRVHAGMWASRERAFNRRTLRATRRVTVRRSK